MLSIYPACFFKEDNGYSVIFPDLNWLATCGKSERDAMSMAVECLAGYLFSLERDGEQFPEPSAICDISIEDVAKELDVETQNAFVSMVAVDVSDYARNHFEKSVRKTLTIPAWLNTAASEKHINFSHTLQEALIAKLKS